GLCLVLRLHGHCLVAGGGGGNVGLDVAVEEGEELVVLALRQGVVLVVVTLSAAERQAEPDAGGGVDAIDDGLDAELLAIDAALAIGERVAVEAGRYFLLSCSVR